MPDDDRVPPSGRDDIEFSATIEADLLRFKSEPLTEVVFFGSPRIDSSSGSKRRNLPDRVEAGVSYRTVRVDYRLRAVLRAEGIVEENRWGQPRSHGRATTRHAQP